MNPKHDPRDSKEKDSGRYHLPPQSIEAEESILASLILGMDPNALIDVVEILSPGDFYRTAHQKIYAAVIELFEKNEPVDLAILTDHLRNKNELDTIGGAAWLARLLDEVPMAVNTPYYARIIHEKACLRRLIEKANEISRRCFEDQGNVDEVIDYAESAIFEISENKIRPAFTAIGEIVDGNMDAIEKRIANKALVTGVPSGFARLDELTAGLQASDLIILAARPSMGKTALALNMGRNAAIDADVPVAVFSLEMSKEQLSMRMLCSEARLDSQKLRGGFINDDDWLRLTDAASSLSHAPLFIDDSPGITATEIRAKSRRLKMEKNIGLIIIDYLQLMKGREGIDRHLEISEISRSLKALAKELNVPVLALSQLNRKLEERADKRPQLSDLRESGAIEQDADVVAFIYRDEVYNKDESNPHKGTAEIILAKQRNGPTGVAPLAFLGAYTRFENLAAGVEG